MHTVEAWWRNAQSMCTIKLRMVLKTAPGWRSRAKAKAEAKAKAKAEAEAKDKRKGKPGGKGQRRSSHHGEKGKAQGKWQSY